MQETDEQSEGKEKRGKKGEKKERDRREERAWRAQEDSWSASSERGGESARLLLFPGCLFILCHRQM